MNVYVVDVNSVSKKFRRVYTYSTLEKATCKFEELKADLLRSRGNRYGSQREKTTIQIHQCQLDNSSKPRTIMTTYRETR